MKKSESVFLSVSRSTQKKLYVSLLKKVLDKFPKIQIPCVGTFALVDVALEAGYKPKDIYASDISLFSALMGALIKNESLDNLGFRLSYEWQQEYETYKTPIEKVAFLVWLMKGLQVRQEIFFEAIIYEYLTKSKEEIISDIAKRLQTKVEKYRGIHYETQDLRSVIMSDSPNTITLVHSPSKKVKDEMEPAIIWNSIEEFNFAKEFANSFQTTEFKDNELWIWSAYDKTPNVSAKNILFAEEVGKNKYEYFCVTRPELFEDHPLAYKIQYKNKKDVKSLGIPILPKSYEVTENTKITVATIQGEHALYYRDLWAHKMGTTKAEVYYLFMLDGMAFGVTGIHLSDVLRLKSTDVMEVFGFDQPLDKHPNVHKLFMMLLTCYDFKRVLEKRIKVNRLHEIKGFKTTCLTKYRKLKSSTGLLTIDKREKLPNGMYKLLYKTPFYRRSFQETLDLWRKEFDVQDLRKNQEEEEGEDEDA